MPAVCHSRLIAAALLVMAMVVFVVPSSVFKVGRGDLPPALECESDEELAEKHSDELAWASWTISPTVVRPFLLAEYQGLTDIEEGVSSAFLSRGPPVLLL